MKKIDINDNHKNLGFLDEIFFLEDDNIFQTKNNNNKNNWDFLGIAPCEISDNNISVEEEKYSNSDIKFKEFQEDLFIDYSEKNDMMNNLLLNKNLLDTNKKNLYIKENYIEEKNIIKIQKLNNKKEEEIVIKNKILDKNKLSKKEKLQFNSLAYRNMKMNYGMGLFHFIEFQKELYKLNKCNKEKILKLSKLINWLAGKLSNFRSFVGWKQLFNNKFYGKSLRIYSKKFFGEIFAHSYVCNSKIKNIYKKEYFSKLLKFEEGSDNPKKLNPFYFNN